MEICILFLHASWVSETRSLNTGDRFSADLTDQLLPPQRLVQAAILQVIMFLQEARIRLEHLQAWRKTVKKQDTGILIQKYPTTFRLLSKKQENWHLHISRLKNCIIF